MPRAPEGQSEVRVVVDRIACTGHGICSRLLPRQMGLDEWGYPVLHDDRANAGEAASAVRLCPARALRVVDVPLRARRP